MKVYLIRNGLNHYKIGYTKHPVAYRIEQLQTGSSSELIYVSECEVLHPTKVESTLHRMYKQYNVISEWFELPDDIVVGFVETAKKLDKNFQFLITCENPFV